MLLMATAEQVGQNDGYGWPATLEDLEATPGAEGHRYELINGEIVVTPPPGIWHQSVAHRLAVSLDRACEKQSLTVLPGAGLMLSHDEVVIPDVVVYRPERPPIRGIYLVPEDIVLAVEVVSRSSRRIDRVAKPEALANHGVPFYLLVDPFPPPVRLTLFALDGGSYDQIAQVEAGTPLHLPDPFNLDLDTAGLG
jgi:Uma2 family endonuclease